MVEFFTTNWAAIMSTLAALLLVADKIVALTPTKSDDEILAKIESVLTSFGLDKSPVVVVTPVVTK